MRRALLVLLLLAPLAAAAEEPSDAARAFARDLLAADAAGRERLLVQRADEVGAGVVQALLEAGAERRRASDLQGALAAFEAAKAVAERKDLALDAARAAREAAQMLATLG